MDNPEKLATLGTQEKEKQQNIQFEVILGRDRLYLQLPMQSVHITTNVVSSYPGQARCTRYNIMWYSLSVICGRLVHGFQF
jgi:hypothetical protein